MRPGAGLSTSGSTASPPAPAHFAVPHSAWHSPVPYLFGGLAAMLGLIAFALLILACSYWKLSGYLDSGEDAEGRGSEGRDPAETTGGGPSKPSRLFEESIVVIMAGDFKPTFLATPTASSAASSAAASFAARLEDAGDAMIPGGKKTESAVSSLRGEATRSQSNDLEPQNFQQ